MDRLTAMALFTEVVRRGSLSEAGRRLNLPLATVSRRVSDLEAHLGSQLFRRVGRGLQLTAAGEAYAVACQRILDDVTEAERAAAGEFALPRGELVVTAPIVFGREHVLPVVTDFLTTWPDIAIRLMLADRIVNLGEEHVDLAVRLGDLPDSSLVASRIGYIRNVVCASPDYLAARGRPDVPGDLARHSVVSFDGLPFRADWPFRDNGREIRVPVAPRLVVNTADAAVDAVRAGLGLTRVLCYQVAPAMEAGALELVLGRYELPPRAVSLVHSGQRLMPAKLHAFLDFATPRLKTALAHVAAVTGPLAT